MLSQEARPILKPMSPNDLMAVSQVPDLSSDSTELVLEIHTQDALFMLHSRGVQGL